MKQRPPTNVAASVKQRVLNLARERKEDFNFLLILYAIERFLYRLSESNYADTFVLKGATLFHLWAKVPHRPTRDVDLWGKGFAGPHPHGRDLSPDLWGVRGGRRSCL